MADDHIDTSRMHPGRRYDYLLGGTDNFPADRASGDQLMKVFPAARTSARENRRFLRRAVATLAHDQGVRQFLDVGAGLPTSPNVHEAAPEARVVYVDYDPLIIRQGRDRIPGNAVYERADLHRSDDVLAAAAAHLDLSRPVGLLLVAVMHFIPDEADAYGIVERLVAAMPAGSYLVMSNSTTDFISAEAAAAFEELMRRTKDRLTPRTRTQFAGFFAGLDLLEPGIVPVSAWRAESEPEPRPTPEDTSMYGGVARIS